MKVYKVGETRDKIVLSSAEFESLVNSPQLKKKDKKKRNTSNSN